jgi:hypothetical protein
VEPLICKTRGPEVPGSLGGMQITRTVLKPPSSSRSPIPATRSGPKPVMRLHELLQFNPNPACTTTIPIPFQLSKPNDYSLISTLSILTTSDQPLSKVNYHIPCHHHLGRPLYYPPQAHRFCQKREKKARPEARMFKLLALPWVRD